MKRCVNFLFLSTALFSCAAAMADGNNVGVKECDDYIDRYQACVNDKVPKESRDALSASLMQMRSAWKAAATNSNAKESLALTCTQASQAAKTTLSAYGCTNF